MLSGCMEEPHCPSASCRSRPVVLLVSERSSRGPTGDKMGQDVCFAPPRDRSDLCPGGELDNVKLLTESGPYPTPDLCRHYRGYSVVPDFLPQSLKYCRPPTASAQESARGQSLCHRPQHQHVHKQLVSPSLCIYRFSCCRVYMCMYLCVYIVSGVIRAEREVFRLSTNWIPEMRHLLGFGNFATALSGDYMLTRLVCLQQTPFGLWSWHPAKWAAVGPRFIWQQDNRADKFTLPHSHAAAALVRVGVALREDEAGWHVSVSEAVGVM
ncbi:unnamed protein product [Protopolystoma xenopodis]|uniref:Uncharacterized protein n=1 Tax=Protopolystoma xenopodis TaxID=117903 RepID=A0A448WDH4_9PLAT|nr:unnamed protein product [Protopolystoma xenopodis]